MIRGEENTRAIKWQIASERLRTDHLFSLAEIISFYHKSCLVPHYLSLNKEQISINDCIDNYSSASDNCPIIWDKSKIIGSYFHPRRARPASPGLYQPSPCPVLLHSCSPLSLVIHLDSTRYLVSRSRLRKPDCRALSPCLSRLTSLLFTSLPNQDVYHVTRLGQLPSVPSLVRSSSVLAGLGAPPGPTVRSDSERNPCFSPV